MTLQQSNLGPVVALSQRTAGPAARNSSSPGAARPGRAEEPADRQQRPDEGGAEGDRGQDPVQAQHLGGKPRGRH